MDGWLDSAVVVVKVTVTVMGRWVGGWAIEV
jgi:hypothetical protein